MTVSELITELQKYEGSLLVTVDGYESGYTANWDIDEAWVVADTDTEWWNGEYATPINDNPDAIKVLNIGGRT